MNNFDFLEPATAQEAAAVLADYDGMARVLAGGTDLLLHIEHGKARPDAVVWVGRIPEMQAITWDPAAGLRIGAAATLRSVELHPVVRERYPALARGAAEVGSVQIRNLATLGGNACNASPSADTSPPLLLYGAQVRIASAKADRVIPVEEFWQGPGRTSMSLGEVAVEILLPPPPEGMRSLYVKHAVRRAMDIALVTLAASVAPGANGRLSDARLALGAVAPVVYRATDAEESLKGGASEIDDAAQLAAGSARPITDLRGSHSYRLAMVQALTRQAFRQLLAS